MRVHRLVKARHAASPLDGEGARQAGGRWNVVGIPLAYCASTLSLAVLELLAHADPAAFPEDLIAIEAEIPDDLPRVHWPPEALPAGWREEAGRAGLQAKGGAWVKAGTSGVLLVPSVIVPSEVNVLVNPAHPDAARILVVGRAPFSLDPRLFQK
jgi:RES domain-containing protein